jgi:hypothetical protein
MAESEVLERRVTALEQEVEGEKLVTRHILEQTRRNGDDIAAIRTQLGRMEVRLDRTESDVAILKTEFRAFRSEFPRIVADTVREVLREPGARTGRDNQDG